VAEVTGQEELDFSPESQLEDESVQAKPKTKVSMNMDDLTFGELETFEDVTGLAMSEAVKTVIVIDPKTGRALPDPEDPKGRPLKETRMSVKAMMGIVYISLLREDPTVKFEDVKKLKLSDIEMEVLEGGDSGKED
jgi:hypothetical protein